MKISKELIAKAFEESFPKMVDKIQEATKDLDSRVTERVNELTKEKVE